MDGFGIIVFVAIILLSIFNNQKKPKKSSPEKPFDPFDPMGPFGMPQPPTPATPPPAKPQRPKTRTILKGDSVGEQIANILREQQKTAKNTRQTNAPQPTIQPAAPAQPIEQTPAKPQGEARPAFDLQQAIIYSEILQPKFKEYE